MEWVSVEKELPTDGEYVLLTYTDKSGREAEHVVTLGFYSGRSWTDLTSCGRGYDGCEHEEVENVTHWMPLPKHPPDTPSQ